MKIEILAITPDPEGLIERAGKTCYKSYKNINANSRGTFIKNIIKRGHESVLEHASITFNVKGVSRSLTHQLVRHRTFKFSQESQRYVSQIGFDYIIPKSIKETNWGAEVFYSEFMENIQDFYNKLIKYGVPKEDARYILPNACYSEITFTVDFRNLRNFLKLRLDKNSQWEIRELANKILEIMLKKAPNCFKDLKK